MATAVGDRTRAIFFVAGRAAVDSLLALPA